jgi:hypothetical protein
MTLQIKSFHARHRDTYAIQFVSNGDNNDDHAWGYRTIVVRLQSDNKWWIVPAYTSEEYMYDDVGPYDDPDTAYAMYKLLIPNIEK